MQVETIKSANLALRFVLELCALAALGYWGCRTGQGLIRKIGLGVGAPLLAALIWGILLAPASSMRVHGAIHLVLQVVIFGLAVAALAAAGRPTLAWMLGIAVVINGVLMYVWRQ
jgi:hypothetical protein